MPSRKKGGDKEGGEVVMPGFGVMVAIAGLLVVAYVIRRRKARREGDEHG